MQPRLYLPTAAANGDFILDAAQSRHLIKVLRLRRDDPLVVFDGAGAAYAATLTGGEKTAAAIRTGTALPPAAADGGRAIHIGQAVCAPAKMDWAVEKMTELGAASITPLLSDNGKGAADARQMQRWQRLVIAACEQCGRNRLPLLHPPQKVLDWQAAGGRILMTPRAEQPLTAVAADMTKAAEGALSLVVGAESGFSGEEEEGLITAGWRPAHLGARILRAETAALAALAVLQGMDGVQSSM